MQMPQPLTMRSELKGEYIPLVTIDSDLSFKMGLVEGAGPGFGIATIEHSVRVVTTVSLSGHDPIIQPQVVNPVQAADLFEEGVRTSAYRIIWLNGLFQEDGRKLADIEEATIEVFIYPDDPRPLLTFILKLIAE